MLSRRYATSDEALTSTVNGLQTTTVEPGAGQPEWSANQGDSETANGRLLRSASAEQPISSLSRWDGPVDRTEHQAPAKGNDDGDPEKPNPGKSRLTHIGAHETLTLSISEAAHLLGIGVSTAYRLCARGEFPVPVLRIGGIVKVSLKRLRDYVDTDGAAAEG